MKKPDIILIWADQMRNDSWGAGGSQIVKTPNLDALSKESLVFDNGYSQCPSCVPARGCALTGLSPWKLGVLGMGLGQPPLSQSYAHTLPSELSKAGYDCVGIGKMHFNPQRALHGYRKTIIDESGRAESRDFVSDYVKWFEKQTGHKRILGDGFDWNGNNGAPYTYEERLHSTQWTADCAADFLVNETTEKPFFLKISFARPHSPYDAPRRFFELYPDVSIPLPAIGEWDKSFKRRRGKRTEPWCGSFPIKYVQKARAGYYGNISFIDEKVGEIIKILKQKNRYEDSLIIFVSDHGDMLGDHFLWRKTYAYEPSVHVPFMMKLPRGERRGRTNLIATHCDLMPTILKLAGVEANLQTDGINLLKDKREFLHGEHVQCYSPIQDMQYIFDGEFKYIWFPRTRKEQLFDVANDAHERNNLIEDKEYSAILEGFREKMVDIFDKRGIAIRKKNGKLVSFRFSKPFNALSKINFDKI